MSGLTLLSRWLLFGEWRAHPMRAVLAVVAIAVGVAMGFAIHLINAAAFNEFNAAVQSLSGQADIRASPPTRGSPSPRPCSTSTRRAPTGRVLSGSSASTPSAPAGSRPT
jgi:hypothetical protein